MLARSTNVELKISRPPRFAVVKNEISSVTELPFTSIETLSISNPFKGGPENMDVMLEPVAVPVNVAVPGSVKLIVVVGEVSVNESALAFTAAASTKHTKKLKATIPRVLMLSSPRTYTGSYNARSNMQFALQNKYKTVQNGGNQGVRPLLVQLSFIPLKIGMIMRLFWSGNFDSGAPPCAGYQSSGFDNLES
jgi:hypothetical protein